MSMKTAVTKVLALSTEDQATIVAWRTGLLTVEEACKKIGISRPQLYRRYKTLRDNEEFKALVKEAL